MKRINNFVTSERQMFEKSIRSFLPSQVQVPFVQCAYEEYTSVVSEGETVSEGQIIAVPKNGGTEKAAAIHSPIPGKMQALEKTELSNGSKGTVAKIALKGKFSYLGKKPGRLDWKSFDIKYLLELFNTKGVINTFDKPVSITRQINKIMQKKERHLIVRLFDEDPSRLTDSFIAKEFKNQVCEGAYIIAKAFAADSIIFAFSQERNYEYDFSIINDIPFFTVDVDTDKYPVGFKLNLLEFIKPVTQADRDDIFVDTETCLAAFKAVVYGIPDIERYVQVTGNCLRSAAIFRTRIGTPFNSLIEQCGGFKMQPAKIIINGLLTGYSIKGQDVSVAKNVKSIHFIPKNELENQNESPCTMCGLCRKICPEGLYPDIIYRHIKITKCTSKQMLSTADLCTGCSLCNAVCPSRLTLSQTIASLKKDEYE